MEFKQVASARHSVRDYTDQPVDPQDIRDIVQTAGKAASWCNSQPWHVYAVAGEKLETLRGEWARRLATGDQGGMDFEGVHRETMTAQAAANMDAFFAAVAPYHQNHTMAPQVLYGAQAVLILTVPKDASPYVMFDLGAFSEQLMLAATDKGLGSLVAAMYVIYADTLRTTLNIPDDEAIAIGIGLGHTSDAPTNGIRTARMDLDQYLTFC